MRTSKNLPPAAILAPSDLLGGQPRRCKKPAGPFFAGGRKPTAWIIKETERRRVLLERFDKLVQGGLSQGKAAKRLGSSVPSIWRWNRRLEPTTNRSGRPSVISIFNIAPALLERVQRAQVGGLGNASAWKALARDPECPRQLAEFLRRLRTVPASFLSATKLRRRNGCLLEGAGFLVFTEGRRD